MKYVELCVILLFISICISIKHLKLQLLPVHLASSYQFVRLVTFKIPQKFIPRLNTYMFSASERFTAQVFKSPVNVPFFIMSIKKIGVLFC